VPSIQHLNPLQHYQCPQIYEPSLWAHFIHRVPASKSQLPVLRLPINQAAISTQWLS